MIPKFKQKRVEKGEKFLSSNTTADITGGTVFNAPAIDLKDNQLANSLNVYAFRNRLKKRFGYKQFAIGLPLIGEVLGYDQFYKYDGTEFLCCFTSKYIYEYNVATKYWDLVARNSQICDCESAWTGSANITPSLDTAWKRYGSQSVKLSVASGFTTGLAAYFNFSSKDVSAYTHLHFYIKSSVNVPASTLKILIDNTNGCVSPLEQIELPALTAGVEKEIEVVIVNPSALSAILSVGLLIATDIGAYTINISDIRATKPYSGSKSDRWETEIIFDSVNGEVLFIATNGVDPIQAWNGTGSFYDLSEDVEISKIVKNFYHFLVVMNQTVSGEAAPQRVQWPVEGKPKDWINAGSGNNSLAQASDFIIGCEFIKGSIAILKERSIAILSFAGGIPPFMFEELRVYDIGCSARGSIQSLGGEIIFLGWDNFYIFDGFNCNPVGDDVAVRMIETMNPATLAQVHTHIIEELNLYICFVPSVSAAYPDIVWVFDYDKERWFFWTFNDLITATGYYNSIDKVRIGDLLDKIGTMSWRIGSRKLSSINPISLFGDSEGYTYSLSQLEINDDGVKIPSFFDTKSYIEDLGKFISLEELLIYGNGTTVDVLISKDDGKTFKTAGTVTLNSQKSVNFLRKISSVSEKYMIRFVNNEVDGWFEIDGFTRKFIKKTDVVK